MPNSYLEETGFLQNNGQNALSSVGHRQRVYARFDENEGINALSEKELLEFLLFYVFRRHDTKYIAETMLSRYGSFAKLVSQPLETIVSMPLKQKVYDKGKIVYLEVAKSDRIKIARLLKAIYQSYSFISKSKAFNQVAINNPAALIQYLKSQLDNIDTEEMHVLMLDSQNKLKKDVKISSGVENQTAFYPRLILRKALNYNAVSIILVHNHPSGNLTPSNADIRLTESMKEACDLLDIKLHDHLIVGKNVAEYYSFNEHGLL